MDSLVVKGSYSSRNVFAPVCRGGDYFSFQEGGGESKVRIISFGG